MLTDRVESWRREGAIEEVLDRKLFVRRRGGGDGAPLLLFLHGFPSSSYDWRDLFGLRPPGEASLAFDFLGFGLSEKPREHSTRSPGRPTRRRSWCGGRAPSASSSSPTTWAPR